MLKASIAVELTTRLFLCVSVGIIKILYSTLTMVYKYIPISKPINAAGGFSKSKAEQRWDNRTLQLPSSNILSKRRQGRGPSKKSVTRASTFLDI